MRKIRTMKAEMNDIYKPVIDVIEKHHRFLVCSHAHPDGDAIGSTLALGVALISRGKEVVMYNHDPVPRNLDFLPFASRISNFIDNDSRFDVTIMVDCSQVARVGDKLSSLKEKGLLVAIDHHISCAAESDVSCFDEGASSTGEVVYSIIKRLGIEITPDIATLILTTLVVDTGFFRYSNTTPHTLKIAADLVEHGASTWFISKNMEERVDPRQFRLLSDALDTIEYLFGGKVAMMVITRQMFRSTGADAEMVEDFINFPRSVDGVEVAVLIREKERNVFKVSFRSKGLVDVAALAARFDGGGHEHAAGCTIVGRLGVVKQKISKAVGEHLAAL